ncbi:hypothetical protein [Streptomyces sp. NPDC051677]|uniref:hypothetical protein n=1 Tax=Streptomyces sp. NPDC051677 TaxID=3365669 RepID=UPI0037D8D926
MSSPSRNGGALRRIGALIDAGAVHVEAQALLPLEGRWRLIRVSREGRVRGKLIRSL